MSKRVDVEGRDMEERYCDRCRCQRWHSVAWTKDKTAWQCRMCEIAWVVLSEEIGLVDDRRAAA